MIDGEVGKHYKGVARYYSKIWICLLHTLKKILFTSFWPHQKRTTPVWTNMERLDQTFWTNRCLWHAFPLPVSSSFLKWNFRSRRRNVSPLQLLLLLLWFIKLKAFELKLAPNNALLRQRQCRVTLGCFTGDDYHEYFYYNRKQRIPPADSRNPPRIRETSPRAPKMTEMTLKKNPSPRHI